MEDQTSEDGRPGRSERVVERVLALCAALKAAPRGLTWRQIAQTVPGYSDSDAGRRTFHRDRQTLAAAGIALSSGDYSAPEYRYQLSQWSAPPRLSSSERTAISLAAMALEGSSSGKAVRRAAERLSWDDEGLSAVHPWQPRLPGDSEVLSSVSRAIARHAPLSFAYVNAAGERSARTIWPWTAAVAHGAWYVAGYDLRRRQARMFRFSRMSCVELLGEEASVSPDPVPLGQRPETVRRLFSTVPRPVRPDVVVAIPPGRMPWIRFHGESAAGPQGSTEVECPEGWETHVLPGRLTDRVITEILERPGEAVLLGPAAAREELGEAIASVERVHDTPETDPLTLPRARGHRVKTTPADRVYRAFTLLEMLALSGPLTLDELSTALGTDEDVLRADILALSCAGGRPEEAGVFDLLLDESGMVSLSQSEGFETAPLPPFEDLVPLTVALGEAARALPEGHLLGEASRSAQLKLLRCASDPAVAQSLLAAGDSARDPESGSSAVLSALNEGALLEFRYLKETEEESTRRVVRPLALRTENGRQYLFGEELTRGAAPQTKHFRVDRCVDWGDPGATDGSASAKPERTPDIPSSPPRWASRRRSRSQPVAWIEVHDSDFSAARELLESFAARNVRESPRGHLVGEINEASGSLTAEVLGARGALSLESPPSLRRKVLDGCQTLRKIQGLPRKII